MLLFYIDEYGDHSLRTAPSGDGSLRLKRGISPWFVLGAVGVRDTSRKPLAEAISKLKSKCFGPSIKREPWEASEIKGRYLFRVARSVSAGKILQSPHAYAVLNDAAKVAALINGLDLLLAKFRPLIFAIGIDKHALASRMQQGREAAQPLGAAYAYLQQRVALTMDQLYAGDSAILVADQQTQHEKYFRTGEMNDVRDGLTSKLPLRPKFKLVMDKPLWIDTDLSTWDREILQLADVVAYSVAECMKRGSPPAEPCYLWDRLTALMAVHWTSGGIEGGGFAIYPRPGAYPSQLGKRKPARP